MIRHVVTFALKEDTSADDLREVEEALGKLPGLIPELVSYEFGRDLGLNAGNGGFAVTALVEKPEYVGSYLDHPEHLRIRHEILGPHVAGKTAVQFAVPDRD
ncbi:Dabb family protein [Amycolatopsis cynarae]|uniref:Dabb family protein n=1 Tax=Amycolatopsis cynarae TaxID=2995223 RepID=A0ABY7B8P2_9PSEU|nr:Dabb family protein [Amycolatopsis sp. HUAS 11-8]WAL67779.1 Dabb family protein [Amycolatopsis sp. HUAS 11-8]